MTIFGLVSYAASASVLYITPQTLTIISGHAGDKAKDEGQGLGGYVEHACAGSVGNEAEDRHLSSAVESRDAAADLVGQASLKRSLLHRVFHTDDETRNKDENRPKKKCWHHARESKDDAVQDQRPTDKTVTAVVAVENFGR